MIYKFDRPYNYKKKYQYKILLKIIKMKKKSVAVLTLVRSNSNL